MKTEPFPSKMLSKPDPTPLKSDRDRIQLEQPVVADPAAAANHDVHTPHVVQYGGSDTMKIHDWQVSDRKFGLNPMHKPPQVVPYIDGGKALPGNLDPGSILWEAGHGLGKTVCRQYVLRQFVGKFI